VKIPWEVGRVLTSGEFESYYKQVIWDFRQTSIRPKEHLPLIDFPLLMKPGEWPKLARLAEKLSKEIAAAEQELLRRPELYDSLGLPADISEVLTGCGPKCRPKGFARVMRFDFHFTGDGWRFSEANADSAGGYIEAYGLTRAMAACYPGFSPPPNPAAAYAKAVEQFAEREAIVAFFHLGVRVTTWESEVLVDEVEKLGMRGVLVSPRQLRWKSNIAQVSTPTGMVTPNLLIRAVAGYWLPNVLHRAGWVPLFCGSKTPISNPAHSILVGTKRLPLVRRELDTPMPTYRDFSPESRSPAEVPSTFQNEWVFKPTLGGGGKGIVVAGVTKKRMFKRIVEAARRDPIHWVAQRRFESLPVPTERGPGHVCLGVYTVDGVAVGAFGRIRAKPLIAHLAMSIPVLIPRGDLKEGGLGAKQDTMKNSTKGD
jgi:hypothetical protein